MNKQAKIRALEARISSLQSKVALQQVAQYFQFVLHSYAPGQRTLTVAVLANAPGPSVGNWAEEAGRHIIAASKQIQKFRRTVLDGLHKSMQSKPEHWGLLTEGGHSKFKARTKLIDSEVRYFPKANRITNSAYLELVFTNPEDFDPETFKHMLQTAAKLYDTKKAKV